MIQIRSDQIFSEVPSVIVPGLCSCSLGENIVRQCIKYSDCNFDLLSIKFPTFSGFKFSCCQTNLCNSGHALKMTTPILVLLGALLSVIWSWI